MREPPEAPGHSSTAMYEGYNSTHRGLATTVISEI